LLTPATGRICRSADERAARRQDAEATRKDLDAMRTRRPDDKRSGIASALLAGVLVSSAIAGVRTVSAGEAFDPPVSPLITFAPSLSNFAEPSMHGISRTFAPRWKASYALGRNEDTDLTAALVRYDQTLAYGTRSDAASRDSWRHFLGVEYQAGDGVSLLGGIAKSNGNASLAPTGYEKLRLNAGARWRGQSWGLDGAFSFIPTGASRYPGDSGYIPSAGGSGMTYLFSLTVSRRF
jgi:hypothetical protein